MCQRAKRASALARHARCARPPHRQRCHVARVTPKHFDNAVSRRGRHNGLMRWQLFAVTLIACSHPQAPRSARTTGAMSASAQASSEMRFLPRETSTQVTCPDAATKVDGTLICPNEAKAQGLTIVDLGDTWTPSLFAPQPDGTAPTFR